MPEDCTGDIYEVYGEYYGWSCEDWVDYVCTASTSYGCVSEKDDVDIEAIFPDGYLQTHYLAVNLQDMLLTLTILPRIVLTKTWNIFMQVHYLVCTQLVTMITTRLHAMKKTLSQLLACTHALAALVHPTPAQPAPLVLLKETAKISNSILRRLYVTPHNTKFPALKELIAQLALQFLCLDFLCSYHCST